jgi:hypothetical protein
LDVVLSEVVMAPILGRARVRGIRDDPEHDPGGGAYSASGS